MKKFEVSANMAAFILSRQYKRPLKNAFYLPIAWKNYCRYVAKNN